MGSARLRAALDAPATGIVCAFLLVLALDASNLRQPPVWDAAFSVFSAAFELVDNGFDLLALSRLPGYHAGGPTMHGSSIVTLVTAAVLWVVTSEAARFVVLHLLHFLVAAVGLVVFRRFARPALGEPIATAVSLVVLLQPAFLVQTGSLYLEIPAFACAMLALSASLRGRTVPALAWTALAAGVKEPGVTVAATLALAALVEAGPWRRRLGRAALYVAAAAPGVLLLSLMYSESPFDERFRLSVEGYLQALRLNVERYLWTAPDLAVLLLGFLAVVVLRFGKLRTGLSAPHAGGADDGARAARSRGLAALFGLCFLGFFFGVLPLSGRNFQVLTRYYLPVLPLFLFLLVDSLRLFASRRITLVVLGVVGVLFAMNRNGLLYPRLPARFGNDFSIAERSGEYRELLAVQRESVRELAVLAKTRAVFYELPVHFLVRDPRLGYVEAPLANGHCILTEQPYRAARLPDFPACFVLLRLSPWLGARRIDAVLNQALRHPDYTVDTTRAIRHGPFEAQLVQIRRRGSACGPG